MILETGTNNIYNQVFLFIISVIQNINPMQYTLYSIPIILRSMYLQVLDASIDHLLYISFTFIHKTKKFRIFMCAK